jgi:hypothetical protein
VTRRIRIVPLSSFAVIAPACVAAVVVANPDRLILLELYTRMGLGTNSQVTIQLGEFG